MNNFMPIKDIKTGRFVPQPERKILNKAVTGKLTDDEYGEIHSYSLRIGLTVSEIVRIAVKEHIKSACK